jgi:16S rRNA (guanine(966)-N(2))-methyltransferase RsmD
MRIISGTWKGRVIKGGGALRPTSDSIKEALFSILGGRIDGLFIDLFAGTGNVGIEAASRGAQAVLVERADSSWELLEANLEALGRPESIVAVHQDVQRFVKAPTEAGPEPARIVFADPPYDYPATEKLLRVLSKSSLVGPDTLIILEHRKGATPARRAPGLELFRQEEYGDTLLSFLRLGPA